MIARWRDEIGDTGALGLVRVCLGVLLSIQAIGAARALVVTGYFADFFHVPIVPSLVPSRGVYVVALCVLLVSALAVVIGRQARAALFVSSIVGAWLMLCDRLQLHNNRWALLCFCFLLSFAPCDRAFVLRRRADDRPPREGPLWAQRLMQAQMAIVYLASGTSKLLDPDWRGGLVVGDRLHRFGHKAPAFLHPLADFLARPLVSEVLSKAAIGTELFLAFGLFVPRTRRAALWLGLCFHLTIEITSKVELFTWLTLAIYALFATPDHRARKLIYDATRARGRAIARVVTVLDWLSRFELAPAEADAMPDGAAVVVIDRDGTRSTKGAALTALSRALPLLFVAWPILALLMPSAGRASANSERTAPRPAR